MNKKKIRLQLRGGLAPLASDAMDAADADRLLHDEVLPKSP
jgi:hypothetical protein